MFDSIAQRFTGIIKSLKGQSRLTEANIQEAMREVRMALLEADVALPVVKQFIANVKERALGQEVLDSLSPTQVMISIVHQELTKLMGEIHEEINLSTVPPAVILMAGLQGSGKTTSSGKLAKFLKEQMKKKVLLVSCDVYRPAAMDQLQLLGEQLEVDYFSEATPDQKPVKIAKNAIDFAKKKFFDVVIVDTAGRLAIDEIMMAEIKELQDKVKPIETYFVVDAMQGQDAVNTAKAFNEALSLTGVILTKLDGDSRGGAALSVRHVTGKPIKFIGVGEKLTALERFHPERMASRILGMGDILTLVEEAQQKVNQEEAEKLTKKIFKEGKDFDFEDFKMQLQQMKNMGGLSGFMEKMPMMMNPAKDNPNMPPMDDRILMRIEGIINSMTPKERRDPSLLKATRKKRIANGSGVTVQDVNKLIAQFEQMRQMMKMLSKGGIGKLMKTMKHLMPKGGKMF